jgi:hypothetical protein
VDGGVQLERRGVGTQTSHRAGASLEGQTRLLPYLLARAGVRADGQARGSLARVEPGGEVGLQLHTTSGRHETGVVVAGAHTARQLAPLPSQDVPSTDRIAVTPFQSLPDDWMLRGEGQLVRTEDGDVAALWSVGVDKWSSVLGDSGFDVSLRLSGGARVASVDGPGEDWTEAVALAWWDPVGRLRLGAAARGQLGTPWVGAPGTSWLPATDEPHVDAGSRIVQGVRLRGGALELEAAGWVRAEPLGPARVEGALRYTW